VEPVQQFRHAVNIPVFILTDNNQIGIDKLWLKI
jgi:hypothetical protein